MTKKKKLKEKILETAEALFHQNGYGNVGLYDIAEKLQVRQGHVFYYFKTKRDIGLEILERRKAEMQVQLNEISSDKPPKESLTAFLKKSNEMESLYIQWGCPIANLTDALLRESINLAQRRKVPLVYETQIAWLQTNFMELGNSRSRSKLLAWDMLTRLQGVIHMSYCLNEPTIFNNFIRQRIDELNLKQSD